MPAYYNEFDPQAAAWLRNLIAAGHLPAGDVDERSLLDVQPEDLNGYEQCHFFAGIGVWPYALRRVGWPDDRPIWTGSCPCQPFSTAGQQLGFDDERHLWPAWFQLIAQRRPAIVVGEQVTSALAWLDLVQNDLEGAGYAVGAADLCAPGFPVESWHESPQHEWILRAIRHCPDPMVAGQLLDFAAWASGNLGAHDGDHIRQRLYFVGVADGAADGRRQERTDGSGGGAGNGAQGRATGYGASGDPSGLVDSEQPGLEGRGDRPAPAGRRDAAAGPATAPGGAGGMENADRDAPNSRRGAADWLFCRDGKWRPVEPGTFPLANAPAGRVGKLRAYGNALDAETVVAFLEAAL